MTDFEGLIHALSDGGAGPSLGLSPATSRPARRSGDSAKPQAEAGSKTPIAPTPSA